MTVATVAMPARDAGVWRRYAARWRRVGKEVVAILALFVTAVAGFSLGWVLFPLGIGLLPLFFFGVFVVAAGLYAARGIGLADRMLLEWAGLPRIPRPTWPTRPGFGGWLRSLFGSAQYWLALVYVLAPQLVVAIVSFTVLTTCLAIGLGGTFWPIWAWGILGQRHASGDGGLEWLLHRWLGGDQWVLEGVIYVVFGLAILVVLPFVTRGLAWAHWYLARALLGARSDDALRAELSQAQASRAAAVAAEDSAVRRIERDIHDGPQQRLIRLQLDLASAGRRVDDDPTAAREFISSAAQQAHDALDELRAVSRGIAPPILLDRGLVAALESAADRNPVPARVESALPAGLVLPPELQRNAYFIAHEALANATKYSEGSRIDLRVAVPQQGVLLIEVVDDGVGGAAPRPGHGLAGLNDRARGFGGRLELASPAGGGTRVTATLPIPDAAGEATPGD